MRFFPTRTGNYLKEIKVEARVRVIWRKIEVSGDSDGAESRVPSSLVSPDKTRVGDSVKDFQLRTSRPLTYVCFF